MPFIKKGMKEKDEAVLNEMKEEIREADVSQADATPEVDTEQDIADRGEQSVTDFLEKLQSEIKANKMVLEEKEKEIQEKEERVKRLQADFDNFRRRTRQEKEELSAVVAQTLITDMLPLLDNFGRALEAEPTDAEALHTGVEMIYKQFGDALKKNGLEAIKTEGEKFDPNFHQAIMRVQDAEKEDDTIEAELQKGYMVRGRVIRPSMVKVVAN
ncbi:MAG: nucleotide exchange factor GrpE [Selenomonadaceae bacterium]